MDLHAGQIQGFFDIPTDNLLATPVLADDIRVNYPDPDRLMIVSPDVGGGGPGAGPGQAAGGRPRHRRQAPLRSGRERGDEHHRDVRGRRCIMFDDIVDSAGTLCNAAQAIIDHGADEVSAYVTHGVLSGAAADRVTKSVLKELVITDSIEQPDHIRTCAKVRQVSIAPLMGEAIRRIANEESVSKLFD